MQSARHYLTQVREFLRQQTDEPRERLFFFALLGFGLLIALLILTRQMDLLILVGGGAALITGIIGMTIRDKDSWMREIAPELIGISIGVMAIDQLYQVRLEQQEKQEIILQLGSPSNDFALEAARIVVHNGWDSDGSLQDADLRYANLQDADLRYADLQGALLGSANLQGADLRRADLQDADLGNANIQVVVRKEVNLQDAVPNSANLQGSGQVVANLQDAVLREANLQGADLSNALYNDNTTWPGGFTPPDTALNWDQLSEEQREALTKERWYLQK